MENIDLLQAAANRQGIFISDMKFFPEYRRRAIQYLRTLKAEDYSLQIWQDTLGYLTNSYLHFDSYDDMRCYLIGELKTLKENNQCDFRNF